MRAGLLPGLVAGALLLLVSCGDDDGGDARREDAAAETTTTESTTTTTEATTTTLSPEEEVLAAYRAAKDAVAASYDPPDPNHPEILAHLGGEALARLQDALTQLQGEDVAYVGGFELHPRVIVIAGEEAKLEDCWINRAQQIFKSTREPHGEATESVLHVEVELQRVDGKWKMMKEQELSEPCTPE